MKNKKTVILVANRGFAIWNSRLKLINRLMTDGYEVIVIVAKDEYGTKLEKVCSQVIYIPIYRGGFSFLKDYSFYKLLKEIYKIYKPILIQHYNAKPVILGSLAAKKNSPNSVIVNTITGLGHAFIKSKALQLLASVGYKKALKNTSKIVFQNQDDMKLFIKRKFVLGKLCTYIPGSGVDIDKFMPVNHEPTEELRVYFIGRLIWQKGLQEFLDIAERIKQDCNNVSFHIVGEIDSIHPDSISMEKLKYYENNGIVVYEGYQYDMRKVYRRADLILFPSHREGFPRVILEASASGVPSVGFNVAGVKEAIINDKTGFLVCFNDKESLFEKTISLLNDNKKRNEFGKNARKMVEENYSLDKITSLYINLYKEIGLK